MHTRRIRELLKEHESTTLDFKRDQYRLTTDEEKGEFIKDLLATPDEITSLTRTTRRRRNPPTRRASLQALGLTVMYREYKIITVRGGRGIPGFAYNPPERHAFSLGEYVRLDAKLLVTPTTPLVIVTALSSATINTSDNQTIHFDRITVDEHAETVDVATARVIRVKSEQRVNRDVLEASRASGIATTINLATARGETVQLEQRLAWDRKTESFTTGTNERGQF